MGADELRETKNRIDYTVMILRDFADAHGMSPRQAHSYLRRYKAMDYMEQFYDVEHTLSPADTVNTLGIICRRNGGKSFAQKRWNALRRELDSAQAVVS